MPSLPAPRQNAQHVVLGCCELKPFEKFRQALLEKLMRADQVQPRLGFDQGEGLGLPDFVRQFPAHQVIIFVITNIVKL